MAAKQQPVTIVAECAQRVRSAEAELDAARDELRLALREHGWTELYSHTSTGGQLHATYQRDIPGQVDPLTGQPSGSVEIASFDEFVRGEAA